MGRTYRNNRRDKWDDGTGRLSIERGFSSKKEQKRKSKRDRQLRRQQRQMEIEDML